MPTWPFPRQRISIFLGVEDYQRLKAGGYRLDAFRHKRGTWVVGVRRYRRGLVIERTTLARFVAQAPPGTRVHRRDGNVRNYRRHNLVVVPLTTS